MALSRRNPFSTDARTAVVLLATGTKKSYKLDSMLPVKTTSLLKNYIKD